MTTITKMMPLLLALLACNQKSEITLGKHLINVEPETEIAKYDRIPSSLETLDDARFDNAIKHGSVFVEFYANWCGTCREVAPILDRLRTRHPDVKFYRVDVDENPISTKANQISLVPTMVMFFGGKRSGSLIGIYPDDVLDRFVGDQI